MRKINLNFVQGNMKSRRPVFWESGASSRNKPRGIIFLIKHISVFFVFIGLFSFTLPIFANGSEINQSPPSSKTNKLPLSPTPKSPTVHRSIQPQHRYRANKHKRRYVRHRGVQYQYTRIEVPYFNGIYIGDGIQLRVLAGQPYQQVAVIGNEQTAQMMMTEVDNGVLVIQKTPQDKFPCYAKGQEAACLPYQEIYNEPIQVTVWANNLNYFGCAGDDEVDVKNLRPHYGGISIGMSGSCGMILHGVVNLRKVQYSSSGRLDVRWVDSNRVTIHGDGIGHIRLAGTTNILNVQLSQVTNLDARYLRAHEVFVRTDDAASAYVTAIDNLSAFAGDYSNIYYFKTPQNITRYSWGYGNVLQMSYWN